MIGDEDSESLFARILSGEIPEDLTEPEAQEFADLTNDPSGEGWDWHDGQQITLH